MKCPYCERVFFNQTELDADMLKRLELEPPRATIVGLDLQPVGAKGIRLIPKAMLAQSKSPITLTTHAAKFASPIVLPGDEVLFIDKLSDGDIQLGKVLTTDESGCHARGYATMIESSDGRAFNVPGEATVQVVTLQCRECGVQLETDYERHHMLCEHCKQNDSNH